MLNVLEQPQTVSPAFEPAQPSSGRLKVLLCAYACEPGRGSEPGTGWNVLRALAERNDVWVLTRPHGSVKIESELARLKKERSEGAQRVSLLRSDRLDPDMLDERARYQLDYANPHDLVRMINQN